MPHTEELLQRETLSENRVFAHERRMVRLENGATAERELIRHPGGVGIVAVDENDRLVCPAVSAPAVKIQIFSSQ